MAPAPFEPRMTPEVQVLARRHWRKTRRLTWILLLVWFAVTFGLPFFARELSFRFFGWPFSFWMAAQGALVVYGVIIAFYAWYMNRLDDRFRSGNAGADPKTPPPDPLHWG
jgi:putative solute:sodium symporter small subunit